jgi:N-acetylmuramoyl-L-alanine amidase
VTQISSPSPNFGPRKGDTIDMLVLHYTGMASAADALARLRDPAAQVSAHYLIDEDGTIHALVPEDMRAWHAGVAAWRGEADVNSRSIGIELVNPGHEFGYRGFPDAQIAALVELAAGIIFRHPIPARNVVGHSDVAPTRKQDPGEWFPWKRLKAYGIGLWPLEGDEWRPVPSPDEVVALLARYGYDVANPEAAIAAFQRHFRSTRMDGIMDGHTAGRLLRLLEAAEGR